MTPPPQRAERRAHQAGHTSSDLREAFVDWVDANYAPRDPAETDTVEIGGRVIPIRWLLGQLWQCTDYLPVTACQALAISQGSTYAVAVRKVAADLREGDQQ